MGSTDPAAMRAVAGKLADAESIVALKDLFNRVGAGDTRAEGVEGVGADSRAAYLFNSNLVGVEDADLVLLVGSDPRLEAPVLNARLRRANVAGGTHVASVGPHGDLTYPVESVGSSAAAIEALASGKHPFRARLDAAERPLIIVGASLLRRPDRDALMKHLHALCDASGVVKGDWNGFNVLHDAGGTVAALDLGFVPSTSAAASKSSAPSLVYSLGAEAFDAPPSAFVVYQGHHGDAGAARADVVLPGAAYTEKPGTYVNTEGRAQRACRRWRRTARRRRTGRSCARSARCAARRCPTMTSPACARGWRRLRRISRASTTSSRRSGSTARRTRTSPSRTRRGWTTPRRSRRPSRTST